MKFLFRSDCLQGRKFSDGEIKAALKDGWTVSLAEARKAAEDKAAAESAARDIPADPAARDAMAEELAEKAKAAVERETQLDAREKECDKREASLDQRAIELEDREKALVAAEEQKTDSVSTDPGDQTEPDDLTEIKGIGKSTAAKLVEAGIDSFAAIVALDDDGLEAFGLDPDQQATALELAGTEGE